MTYSTDFSRLARVSPSNWLIVAAAALGGKMLLRSNLAALAAVGAVLVFYVLPKTPCCDSCSQGDTCGSDSLHDEVDSTVAQLGGNAS